MIRRAQLKQAEELAEKAKGSLLIDLASQDEEEEGTGDSEEPERDLLDPAAVAKSLQEHLHDEKMEEEEEDDDDVEGIAELIERQQDEAEAMAVDKEAVEGNNMEVEVSAVGAQAPAQDPADALSGQAAKPLD